LFPTTALADTADDRHSCVSSIADLDGDGIRDLLVSNRAPDQDSCVWALSGKSGALIYRISGIAKRDGLGGSLAEIGDVDHDGVSDFAAGALRGGWVDPRTYEGSYVRLISGKDGHTLRTITSDWAGDQLGYSVSHAGDANGDGVPDVLVGNPGARLPLATTKEDPVGACLVISGADGSKLRTIWAPKRRSSFGSSVAHLGDIDGDGKPDWAVGAPRTSTVHLFSGKTGAPIGTLPATGDEKEFGWCIAAAPRASVKDRGWLAIAAQSRYVRLWSLPDLEPGMIVYSHTNSYVDEFGSSIDFVRDPATKAVTAVVVGANESTGWAFDEGYAILQPLDGSPRIDLGKGERHEGFDVCALDDIDGDGICDVVVVYGKSMQVCFLSGKDKATLRVVTLVGSQASGSEAK
jgi:hypothetical protein